MAIVCPDPAKIRTCSTTGCVFVGELECDGDNSYALYAIWLQLDAAGRASLRTALDQADTLQSIQEEQVMPKAPPKPQIIDYTKDEWTAEAIRRFGPEKWNWKFVCPGCGHVASMQDWKDAGASIRTVGFSCVGRYLETGCRSWLHDKGPGPCDYTTGGLICISPVRVRFDDGTLQNYFDFAPAEAEAGAR